MATALIRCLKTQVEEAWVYAVIKGGHRWLLNGNDYIEHFFFFGENPLELLGELTDFLPDYLIDLDGRREVRRFKNRLKVMDFTIKARPSEESWTQRAFHTCTLFDVQDDGKGPEFHPDPLDPELLPSEFLNGYLLMALDSSAGQRGLSEKEIIELAVMIEKPIVVTGTGADRDLANRISQSSGCAVFPTCGDLDMPQNGSVLGSALGAIVFDPLWEQLAGAIGKDKACFIEGREKPDLKDVARWARSLFPAGHGRTSV